jgi:hypothetical protein
MLRTSALIRRAVGLCLVVPAVGIAQAPAARTAPKRVADGPASGVITINAWDYFYEAPNPIPGGVVTFRLVNKGQDFHNVWIVKIDEGYAFSDFMRSMGPGRTVPGWLTGLGGPESPEPGQESRLTVELPPGRYALACLLPAKEHGTTHIAKGMFLPLTVTKGGARRAPVGDIAVRITRDGFAVPASVTAGTHTLAVYSESPTPRGFRLARMADGKSATDAAAWIAAGQSGPAPFSLVGGTTPMAQGAAVWMPFNFSKGQYALLPMAIDNALGELRYAGGSVAAISVP